MDKTISTEELANAVSKVITSLRADNRKAHEEGGDWQKVCENNAKIETGVTYLLYHLGLGFTYSNGKCELVAKN